MLLCVSHRRPHPLCALRGQRRSSMRAVRVCNTFSTLHRELRNETNTPGVFWSRTKRRESRLESPIRGRCRTSPTAHHFARTWTTSLW